MERSIVPLAAFVDGLVDYSSTVPSRVQASNRCAAIVFTKDRLGTCMDALRALQSSGLAVLVVDDSTTNTTKNALDQDLRGGVFYHGPGEQRRFMQMAGFRNRTMVLGQSAWHLPGCRNYAMLLARACGLERVLLIDDDIVVANHLLPHQTLSLVEGSVLFVGAHTAGRPDDSVVGHLARGVEWRAPRFVSGQYLALHTASARTPFPNCYNEDWLLILMNGRGGRILSYSEVTQMASDSATPIRATAVFQEFGEVASEGAILALHSSSTLDDEGAPFWAHVLADRRARLHLLRNDLNARDQLEGVSTIDAVLRRHQDLDAEMFVRFFRDYRDETERWGSRLELVDPLHLAASEVCRVIPS